MVAVVLGGPVPLDPRCNDGNGHHKRSYSKDGAKRAARSTAAVFGGPPLEPYRGPCGRWHVGHTTSRRDRGEKETG